MAYAQANIENLLLECLKFNEKKLHKNLSDGLETIEESIKGINNH